MDEALGHCECDNGPAAAAAPAANAMGSAGAMPCSVTTTPPGGMGGAAPGHMGWKRLVGGGPPTAPGSLRADTDADADADATDAARDGGRLLAE